MKVIIVSSLAQVASVQAAGKTIGVDGIVDKPGGAIDPSLADKGAAINAACMR